MSLPSYDGGMGSRRMRLALGRYREVLLIVSIGVTAVVSIGVSVVVLAAGRTNAPENTWVTVEVLALLALIAIGVRWGRGAWAYGAIGLAVIADEAWLIRFVPDIGAGGLMVWSLGPVVAATIGGYDRYLDHRVRRSILAATTRQRRKVERDLHDFVAHDVSGILARAQAAQYVSGDDPRALRAALADIEQSAERALETMDRTMRLLRDGRLADPLSPPGTPGLAEMPAIIAVFADSITGRVDCEIEGPFDDISREQDALACRILVECLTNVRRHARSTARVAVTVRAGSGLLVATVFNSRESGRERRVDGGPHSLAQQNSSRSGGTGLAESVRAAAEAGGSLEYGPVEDGWRVVLTLPLMPIVERSGR